jgi:hypothetical protein
LIAISHVLTSFPFLHLLQAASTGSLATRHDEFAGVGELTSQPGLNDLLNIARYK